MRVGKLDHAVRKHSHRDDADQLGHGEETATRELVAAPPTKIRSRPHHGSGRDSAAGPRHDRLIRSPVAPFGPGTISLRLYPPTSCRPQHIVRELSVQGGLALRAGFDGVMTSEHHGGFAGYMAQPLQMASSSSPSTQPAGRLPPPLAAAPLHRARGRGGGLAPRSLSGTRRARCRRGALPLDFEATGVDQRDAVARFKSSFPRLVAMLRGVDLGPLEGILRWSPCRTDPVPVLSAAVSVTAADRAAKCGAGILMEGMSTPVALARLTEAYAMPVAPAPRFSSAGSGSVASHPDLWRNSGRSTRATHRPTPSGTTRPSPPTSPPSWPIGSGGRRGGRCRRAEPPRPTSRHVSGGSPGPDRPHRRDGRRAPEGPLADRPHGLTPSSGSASTHSGGGCRRRRRG